MELINNIPDNTNIYISSILPIVEDTYKESFRVEKTNNQISRLNMLLEEYVNTKENVHFLNTAKYLYDNDGQLNNSLHVGDGVHLNTEGNLFWVKGIKEELKRADTLLRKNQ